MDRPPESALRPLQRSVRAALLFVVMLGVVSLLSDVTYEGARSITGPYLATLGASAALVGLVAGLGELLGYGLRLVSGYVSDRTRQYWPITILGYVVNLVAVPLLALAGSWPLAALLIVAERIGKAIRTPARDALLAQATQKLGHGWGFGLHEALDQIGALLGPLLVAAVLARQAEYRLGFAVLALPALLALLALLIARLLYPQPQDRAPTTPPLRTEGLERRFWLYLAAVALLAAGFADFPLIAYHLERVALAPARLIPLLYAMAMGTDALAALIFGRLFDRLGLAVLLAATLVAALVPGLVFLGGFWLATLGVALWGVALGAQESIMRAALAGMVPAQRRGTAYGVFNAAYGVCWFLGSLTIGLLYDRSLTALVVVATGLQLAAVPLLWSVRRPPPAAAV
ncbi:MFS transporter [Kallotenue papyrolyticum]|uniref:MFS transporter n=1 Tax=Kallotenue papyrolyticum TaxID=1325125 RepID=UPI00046FC8AA|nr:MFS transporter [Kallotenue papyrolyticum]